MKKLFILLVIAGVVWGCKKKETPPPSPPQPCSDDPCLTADELSWGSAYTDNIAHCNQDSTFPKKNTVYISSTGLYDTGKVSVEIRDPGGYIDQNTGCYHGYQILNVYIDSFQVAVHTLSSFDIFNAHYNQWQAGNEHSEGICGPIIGAESSACGWYPILTTQNNVIINSVSYNDVYTITQDTIHNTYTQPIVWRMYYTKANGILEFDILHGLSWYKIN